MVIMPSFTDGACIKIGIDPSKGLREKRVKQNWKRTLAEGLALPKEACEGLPFFSFLGREEVTVENVTALLSCTPDCIRLMTNQGPVRLEGERLWISAWDQGQLSAQGWFCRVCWEEEKR